MLSIFTTIPVYEHEAAFSLYRMEVLVVLWLTLEFIVRLVVKKLYLPHFHCIFSYSLWAAGVRSRYQGLLGRFKFMTSTFCLIGWLSCILLIVALIKNLNCFLYRPYNYCRFRRGFGAGRTTSSFCHQHFACLEILSNFTHVAYGSTWW